MIEQHIEIPTADGRMNTFVVHPEEGGPHPVVLFYMDAPGKREELHDMARRLAAVGYYVLLPNLYYRRTREFQLTERTEAAMAQMFALMNSLDAGTTRCDTRAMFDYLKGQTQADGSRVGALGYCMSGPFVVWAAAAFAGPIKCIASIHGANMATDRPDSPHQVVSTLRCESYFACAETDKWAPAADIDKLRSGLVSSGAPHRIEWYEGTEHGFVFPQRGGIYNRVGSERHWERLFALFARNLQRSG